MFGFPYSTHPRCPEFTAVLSISYCFFYYPPPPPPHTHTHTHIHEVEGGGGSGGGGSGGGGGREGEGGTLVSACPSVRLWTESCPQRIIHNTCRIHFIFTDLINQLQ